MTRIALIATAALSAAGPAHALSCLRPDPAATFRFAAEAEETYVVLRGSFAFDEKAMPEFDGMTAPDDPPQVIALFDGMALGADGFTIPYRTELILQPQCLGPWCGSMTPAVDAVAFARDNGQGVYVVDLDPCGTTVFNDPTPAVIDTLTDCMAGGPCAPAR